MSWRFIQTSVVSVSSVVRTAGRNVESDQIQVGSALRFSTWAQSEPSGIHSDTREIDILGVR